MITDPKILPDDGMTVMLRLNDEEYPVWPAFYCSDRESWVDPWGALIDSSTVLGWAELEDVAALMDGGVK